MNKISPCLWFDGKAEEAVKFYTSLFKHSEIGATARYSAESAKVSGQAQGSVMTVEFKIENLSILALNGGPHFKFTPAMSLFVWCDSEKEIETLWQKLNEGGEARMALQSYPWAQKYGWTSDRFGVEWQLILAPNREKIAPGLLFVDKLFGKGEEAINFYTTTFPNSKIENFTRDESTKTVAHSVFSLFGQNIVLMEGAGNHGFTFNEAFSLMINCSTQEEIDRYWDKLTSDGGSPSQCGWLKDKYGVSWQLVPEMMSEAMKDPKKAERVMKAVLKMTKPDLQKIKEAAEQA